MRRLIASFALLTTLATTPACTMSRSGRTTTFATGGAMLAGGLLLAAAGAEPVDSDADGRNEWAGNDDFSRPAFGALLALGGLVLVGIAAGSHPPVEGPAPAPVFVTLPSAAPGALSPPAFAPAPRVLPEVATTDDVLRMAQQVRSMVLRGDCAAAHTTLVEIRRRDAEYGLALGGGPVMSGCERAP